MRRLWMILLALAVAALFCIPTIPQSADAQISQNMVIIKTDYQLLGLTELHGGGHLTYELGGTAARDLRRAVLATYDTNGNGRIDSAELRTYIAAMESILENSQLNFFAGFTISYSPLHKLDDISTSAIGFTTVTEVENDINTPVRIFLYFDARNFNILYPGFELMNEIFLDALFHTLSQEEVANLFPASPPLLLDHETHLNLDTYTYQYKHTDYRVSVGSMQSPSVSSGTFHIVRTPAGEIGQYTVTFQYGDMPIPDSATFRPFDFLENPQILFALVFLCGYMISTFPTRMYANYKFSYPRRFRHKALKITWLHILSKVMVVLLIVFYFFPTIFAFISPNMFLSGAIIWVLSIALAVAFVVLAKLLYDRKIDESSKENLDALERRRPPVRKVAPKPAPSSPSGVNVTVHQPAQAQQPAPPPVKEKPTGPPCNVCKEPMIDFNDVLKCKCGQLYHESCAHVAKLCTKCGNALVEIIPEGPAKVDVKCPTCGQMNSVEEDTDLLLVQCGKCGVLLEKIADGYNYLVVDNDHTTAFKMFVSLLKNDCTGLSISTTFPDKLKKEHAMENAEVIWLTDTTVADKKTINPHRLEFEMMRMYAAFVKGNPKSAIILDGFEYLVVENGFDKVFKFIKKINDLSSVNNATLIVPIGTSSLEADQLGTLKKEFDKVIDMVGNGED